MHTYFHLSFSLTIGIGFLLQLLGQFIILDWTGDKTIKFILFIPVFTRKTLNEDVLYPHRNLTMVKFSFLIQTRKGRN